MGYRMGKAEKIGLYIYTFFFFRALRLQNHQENTAPRPSCAHALTIHNTMHFSNALFSFGKTSILK